MGDFFFEGRKLGYSGEIYIEEILLLGSIRASKTDFSALGFIVISYFMGDIMDFLLWILYCGFFIMDS